MALLKHREDFSENPLDMVQRMAVARGWTCDRASGEELGIVLEGRVATYRLAVSWLDENETLHFSCAFDLNIPSRRRGEIDKLILKTSARLWFGHFEHWLEERLIMLRYSLMLSGGAHAHISQIEAIIEAMSATCDRFYPAFHYVSWANLSADSALEVVTFGTEGEA